MDSGWRGFLFLVALVWLSSAALALPPVEGEVFGITPITNEISFYKNVDDGGYNRGETVQIVAINSIKLGTEFFFEFTADFNWDMSDKAEDHYIELSLVKPVFSRISVNYQRIMSSFEAEPVNQFGFRISF